MGSEKVKYLHTLYGLGDPPEGWHWLRLDEVCAEIYDCPHSTPAVTDAGPLMVRTQDILSGTFRSEQAAHVSEATYRERIQRAEPRHGDLFYSREGTYFGIAAEVPPGQRVCLGQRMVLLRPDANVVQSRFLRYWLNSPVMARYIHGFRDGTVAERLNLPTIRALPVLTPPKLTQQAIACILGAMDDKIELNRRMNETLEAMARAIFQSWFVDFEPVRAKAAGEQPSGLASHIADLFPDEFEISELGEIPKDWRVGPLAEICDRPQYGYTASASDEEIGPKFLRITDINKVPWIDWATVPYCPITQHEYPKYRLYPGDVLIARMADPGHGTVIEEEVEAVFASYLIRFRPTDGSFSRYLQYWLRSDDYWNLVRARQAGTTRASLNAQVISAFPLLIPNRAIVEAFRILVDSLRNKVSSSVRESSTLAAVRNTLLPKLISGELRVREAERLVKRYA